MFMHNLCACACVHTHTLLALQIHFHGIIDTDVVIYLSIQYPQHLVKFENIIFLTYMLSILFVD